MKHTLVIILCLLLFKSNLKSQNDTIGLIIEIPIVDLPYQFHASETKGNFLSGYANPSMKQSLDISNAFYSSAHWGIKKMFSNQNEFRSILFSNTVAAAFDVLASRSIFSNGWLHEEYHRAVLTRREIDSFNEMNTFPYGKSVISVSQILDSQLEDISDNHNSDFRRLMAAGNEAGFHQIQSLQKSNFYYNQDLPHLALYWMNSMTNIFYVSASSSEQFDELVDEVNISDGTDVSIRDFAGPDFTAWVDALFNPNKAYADRGIHPSGVGINRYLKPSDLSTEALEYLVKQGNLQWLNLVSPHLVGFPKIKLFSNDKGDYYGNFALRHLLTPFGNDINLDLFYQTPSSKLFFALHVYNNLNKSFGGIEAAIFDKQLPIENIAVSVRSLIWMQPEDLSFINEESFIGGLLSFKASYKLGIFNPYFQIEAKTRGWAMGNVFLDEKVNLNFGVLTHIK